MNRPTDWKEKASSPCPSPPKEEKGSVSGSSVPGANSVQRDSLPDHSTIRISPRLRPQLLWRRGRAVLALAVIGLLAGFIWILAREGLRHPVYRVKSLEVWLRTYSPRSPYQLGSPHWKETDDAVRHIGTNGIQTLVRMIRAKDSNLKLTLVALAQKQHV